MLHPRPCAPCLKSASFNRFRSPDACTSAHVFAYGFLKAALRSEPLPSASLRRYLAWDWLCSRYPNTIPPLGIDCLLSYGTLAQRTSKQPGSARHTTSESRLSTHTRRSLTRNVRKKEENDSLSFKNKWYIIIISQEIE